MCRVLVGVTRTLDGSNNAIRRQIEDQGDDIQFHNLWRTGMNIVSADRSNPIRIDNQGVQTHVTDSNGNDYGPGQRIAAQAGSATFAVVQLADSLQNSPNPDAVVQAVQNALLLSAGSDPGCAYVVVPR